MKKIILICLFGLFVISCGDEKEAPKTTAEKTTGQPPEAVAQRTISMGEDLIEGLKNAENKDDIKSLYKNTVGNFADMIPGALTGFQSYVESKGGIEKMQEPENQEAMMEEFKDEMADFIALGGKFDNLEKDEALAKKMEKIGNEFTDENVAELLKFTLDTAKETIEDIANDADALKALNWLAATGGGPSGEQMTKESLLKIVSDYEKEMKGKSPADLMQMFQRMF